MSPAHAPSGPIAAVLWTLAPAAALLFVAGYWMAAARLRRRGDAWPRWRDASFGAGGITLAWAALGPLPGGPFTRHMALHLLTGMAAPLLLVLARPLTLVLRSLPPGRGRRGVVALGHSRPVAVLVFPPVAALLDAGGLWLLHRTPLFATTQHRPLLHAVVQVHLMAAGLLFVFAVCRLDPVRHRGGGIAVRGGTLLAAGTAHAVLAKSLYAAAPPGTAFAPTDLHAGARLMYYSGDLTELALALVLAVEWCAATGRAWVRARRRLTRSDERTRCEPVDQDSRPS
ncbi:cytochrome c oxidase assembly protein [Streptomyces roseolus]|uniref:cytochrome c oxidase assembly protein n=1 Tax=Streptomyces roseolus TaxID=67358 RepID=UPI00379C9BC1